MLNEFIAYLEAQVANGSIYVLGAQGQTGAQITEAWIKMREHYNSKNYKRAITFWKSQLAKGYTALRAYDCSGLGMYWMYNLNRLYSGDMTAHGMYSKCEAITRDQLKKGDWVFRKNSVGRKYHIGYVVDDALHVIECYGRDKGVIKRHVDVKDSKGKAYWNSYGRPKIFKAEIEGSEETDVVRGTDNGEAIKQVQLALFALDAGGKMDIKQVGNGGPNTSKAIADYKVSKGLPDNSDVDAVTWAAITADLRAITEGDESVFDKMKVLLESR